MNTYDLDISRDGNYWLISIPTIDGVTQADTWTDIPRMATEFISLMTDIDHDNIHVVIRDITIGADRSVTDALHARNIARQAELRASRLTLAAARTLRNEGLPLREVGAVLGVSHQRAAQLLAA